MYIDPSIVGAGLAVGFVIGLTGMGGGALTTPILVLVFGVQPLAAVSSDLVASLVMKPFGSAVHLHRGTVNWSMVRWLTLGSVPAAFAGVLIIRASGSGLRMQQTVTLALGCALVLAATAMTARLFLDSARSAHTSAAPGPGADPGADRAGGGVRILPVATVLTGVLGGLLVGMTSTGSGTVVMVCLTVLYPTLPLAALVGTDLVQAVPLVGAAALGHLLFGDVQFGLTATLLIGSIPGVLLGARLSSHAPDLLVRPAMVFVLAGTAMKLLGASTPTLGLALLALGMVGLPLWALFDTSRQPACGWAAAGLRRRWVLLIQALGIPLCVGPVTAVLYFARVRPRLRAGARHHHGRLRPGATMIR
mgnify:CR=1 FL=1